MCSKIHLTTVIIVLINGATTAPTPDEDPPKGYHRLEGIPTAARIKAMEERNPISSFKDDYYIERLLDNTFDKYSFVGGLIILLPDLDVSYCDSSLLSSNRLVTAAHCWDDGVVKPEQMTVVLGSPFLFRYNYYDGLRIITDKVVTHPDYKIESNGALKHDIAIIYIPEIIHKKNVFPIAIPDSRVPPLDAWQLDLGRLVVGFGLREFPYDQYRKIFVRFIQLSMCQDSFPFPLEPEFHYCVVVDGVREGTCDYDSGAPVIAYSRPYLIGILSQQSDPKCKNGGGPTLFTRVVTPSHLNFIKSHVNLPTFEYITSYEDDPPTMVENITMYLNYTYNVVHKYNNSRFEYGN